MSNPPQNLTRNQLAQFLPNARAVRAFEQILKQVGSSLPTDVATLTRLIEESNLEASTGVSQSSQILDELTRISNSLDLLVQSIEQLQTVDGDVLPAIQPPRLTELPDVDTSLVAAGDVLIYSQTFQNWVGSSLTAGDNIEVLNGDGSITIRITNSPVVDSISSEDPTSGPGPIWKFGSIKSGTGLTLNTTNYVEISIGGTIYKLALAV